MQDKIIEPYDNHEEEQVKTTKKGRKKQTSEERKRDIFLKILSVFTAVIIWFTVMGVDSSTSEKKFTSVPVHHENEEIMKRNGLSIIVDRDIAIDVVVAGKRAAVNGLRQSDIYAYIDFANITSPGEHLLSIEIRELDNNLSVTEQSETHTMRYIDTRVTINLQVNADIRQSMTEQGVTLTPLNIKPDIIEVSGPRGVLETLSHAQVNLNLSSYGRIERSLTVTERIILINGDGDELNNPHIRREQMSAEVFISVEAEKEIPIEVNLRHGFYTERNTVITVTPSVLRVRGSPDFLSTLDKITLPIDEKKIENPENTQLSMDIPLTEGRNMSGISTAVIDIEFINMDSRTLSFNTSNLTIIPPNGLEYNIREENLRLKFLGPTSNLNTLRQSGITATIDLSKITEKGNRMLPIDITVNSDDFVFCVGEYTVNVEVY